ncbi:MAG: hypothetical protein QMB62_09920, partial [Oscillospiraceae bacterium]
MSETLLGVIIGASAAILGGIIGEIIKYCLENRIYKKELKCKAYELIERSVLQFGQSELYVSPREALMTLEEMKVKSLLYASPKINEGFQVIVNNGLADTTKSQADVECIQRENAELVKLMRVDLGTDKMPFFDYSRSPIVAFFSRSPA